MKLPIQIYYRAFLVSGLISLVVTSGIFWFQMIRSHELRTGSDFIAFFTAAEIATNPGGYASIYNINEQYAVQTRVVGFELNDRQILLYNHMPFMVPLLDLLINKAYIPSFCRWALMLIAVYGIAIIPISQTYPEHWRKQSRWISLSVLTFFPFSVSLIIGQDTAFLALGTALFIAGIWKNDDWLAGLGLTVMLVRPHIAVLIAVPVFFRRPMAFLWFLVFSLVLTVFSVFLISIEGVKDFINILLISTQGEWYGMNEAKMLNILGLLIRTLPEINDDVKRIFSWLLFVFSAIFLSLMWKSPKNKTIHLIGISILTALFCVPHLHYHDLTLIVFPLILSLYAQKGMNGALAVTGCSLLFLFSQANELLLFTWPYVLGLILFVKIFQNRQIQPVTKGD